MSEEKVEFKDLNAGFEFKTSEFQLDLDRVVAYLKASDSNAKLYLERNFVPPVAVGALAMGSMMDNLVLPPGAIHVSQDFVFHRPAGIGEKLRSSSSVKRKVDRSRLQMLTITISVTDSRNQPVLTGDIGFIVPPAREAA